MLPWVLTLEKLKKGKKSERWQNKSFHVCLFACSLWSKTEQYEQEAEPINCFIWGGRCLTAPRGTCGINARSSHWEEHKYGCCPNGMTDHIDA
jgi:hypothetical protein